jgi:hypothetical protein
MVRDHMWDAAFAVVVLTILAAGICEYIGLF